jgi:hypothetical protein
MASKLNEVKSSPFRMKNVLVKSSPFLGRMSSANMAGTVEAASGTATASVPLKAPRSPREIFEIVSSASNRAVAKGKSNQSAVPFECERCARGVRDKQTALGGSDRRTSFMQEAIVKLFKKKEPTR